MLSIAKKLTHSAKFGAGGAMGGTSRAEQTDVLEKGVDILVGSPSRLLALNKQGACHLCMFLAVPPHPPLLFYLRTSLPPSLPLP